MRKTHRQPSDTTYHAHDKQEYNTYNAQPSRNEERVLFLLRKKKNQKEKRVVSPMVDMVVVTFRKSDKGLCRCWFGVRYRQQ
jgi:hypothetical protein